MGITMDQSRATTTGDGLTKLDRKNLLLSDGQKLDQSDKDHHEASDHSDPWAKVSAASCTAGSAISNDSACKTDKLPHVELVTYDPGAQKVLTDATQSSTNNTDVVRHGESVLKRLAVAAEPSNLSNTSGLSNSTDVKPLGSGFQSVAQVSLRPDALVDKSGKTVSAEALVVTPVTTNSLVVPTVKLAELVVKESTPSGRVDVAAKEPTAKDAATTTVAAKIEPHGNQSPVQSLVQSPVQSAFKSAAQVTLKPETQGQSGFQTAVPTALKVETQGQSRFQSVAQVSLRPDVIVDKSGKTLSNESLVIAPIVPITLVASSTYASTSSSNSSSNSSANNSTAQRLEQPARIETASNIAAPPTIRASDLVVKESSPGSRLETVTPIRTELAMKAEPATKVEPVIISAAAPLTVASKDLSTSGATASKLETSGSQSGFQNVAQVSLRPDAIIDNSGKTVAREALVVAPLTATVPLATISQNGSSVQRSEQAQATDTNASKLAPPVIKASDLVVKDGNSTSPIPVKDVNTAPSAVKPDTANLSGFQNVAQVSLRADAIVDKSGKTVSNESLVIAPIAQILPLTTVSQSYNAAQRNEQPQTTDSGSANVSAAPVTVSSKDFSTSGATASKLETGGQSGFQNVAQVSLRPDAIVDTSGKIVAREALVIAPLAAIVPLATISQNGSSVQKSEQSQATDTNASKLAPPVIKASDLVVKDGNSTSPNPVKDVNTAPSAIKPETANLSGFQTAAQVSLRPDGIVDKSGKSISTESIIATNLATNGAIPGVILGVVPGVSSGNPAAAQTSPAAVELTAKDGSTTQGLGKIDQAARILDGMQTAANSKAPKPLGFEHSQTNQLGQPATALSAALAAAINGRMLGQQMEPNGKEVVTAKIGELQVKTNDAVVKAADVTGKSVEVTAKLGDTVKANETLIANKQTSIQIIHIGQAVAGEAATSAVKGNILGVKAEAGAIGATTKEGAAPKADLSVNAEIKMPLSTKGKKAEEDDDDSTVATTAKVIGGGSGTGTATGPRTGSNSGTANNTGTGTGVGTNAALVNGQPIDPTVAGQISGITPKPHALPPLEITDKENEAGKSSKHGSPSSTTNATNKANSGPSQKEMSAALQAMIEKRRKERAKKTQSTKAGTKARTEKKPVYKPEKQRRCLVLKGDTLDSLAEQYLDDSDLAELIYEINKGFWRETRRNGMIYLEVIPGSTIFLPTEEEIAIFRQQKALSGKAALRIKCAPPKAVRSLRQSLKQSQQAAEPEHTLALQLETEQEAQEGQEDTSLLPPKVFTAQAPAQNLDTNFSSNFSSNPTVNPEEKALALQFISHLAQVADTSRVLVPNQAKEVRELEDSSRVAVVGDHSGDSAYSARIEVFCDRVWQPVMEYVIGGSNDAILKIYSRCGKIREIDLDLPANIIREMAFNDLNTNRLHYCKKYLLGRKIFC
ncbi:hypothetical protein BH11CYA1_BH11CYA1_44700 [soil metagenome]